MLAVDDLDDTTVERAGALMARGQVAARQARPELPAAFEDAGTCAAALQRLRDSGYHGPVVSDRGPTSAVMTAMVRATPAGGRYVRLPPEGNGVWSRYSIAPHRRYGVLRLIDRAPRQPGM